MDDEPVQYTYHSQIQMPAYPTIPAIMTCQSCGATVQPEDQIRHTTWHSEFAQRLADLEICLFQKSLREIEADLS